MHTDFDDFTSVLAEARRVLPVGGTFVYLGVHPCFGSPFIGRNEATDIEGAAAIVHPGYKTAGWQRLPADADSTKTRARVGINHVPLAALLMAFLKSGFSTTHVEEPGDADPPFFLAFRTTKP